MKKLITILVFLMANIYSFAQSTDSSNPTPTTPAPATYTRPDKQERFKKYVHGTIGPMALVGPMLSVTINQIRNKPREWERTPKGFAKRMGDSFGRSVISHTITYGLDEALKLDSHYYRSPKDDFKSKFSNAVISTFTARNEKGKRVPGIPALVGTYSAAIIANETWMPKRYTYKDGLKSGSISIAVKVGYNLLREFVLK